MDSYAHLPNPDAHLEHRLTTDVLHPIFDVNGQLLGAIAQMAAEEAPRLPMIAALREEWRRLDTAARTRMARAPLLVEVAFDDPGRWQHARQALPRKRRARRSASELWLPRPHAARLTRTTLLIAWYLLRTHAELATLLLGVESRCAGLIADLSLQEVQEIAARHCDWILPRWAQEPGIWRSLIDAARQPEVSSVGSPTLRAIQLFTARQYRPSASNVFRK